MRRTSRGLIAAAVLTLTMSVAAPAHADPSLESLAKRSMAGKLTASDWQYLDANPQLKGIIPAKVVVGEKPMTAAELESVAAAAATCAGTNRYQTHKSLLGSTIFKYNSFVYWCWDGSGTHIRTHYPYLSSAQSVVVFKSTLINTVRSFGIWSKETHHQAHIELCTLGKLGGCYANIYPSNWVLVKNAPGSTFRWSR